MSIHNMIDLPMDIILKIIYLPKSVVYSETEKYYRLLSEEYKLEVSKIKKNNYKCGTMDWYHEDNRIHKIKECIKKRIYKHKLTSIYYNLLLVNKEFHSRLKCIDILVPMIGVYSNRYFNKASLIMIMKELRIDSITLPPKSSYNRFSELQIPINHIKVKNRKRESTNPDVRELKYSIRKFIEDNNIYVGSIDINSKLFYKRW